MIKVLRLKPAIYLIVIGVIGLIVFKVMESKSLESAIYVLRLSGFLFFVAAIWSLYPILVAKKINDREVQLDPNKQDEVMESALTDKVYKTTKIEKNRLRD